MLKAQWMAIRAGFAALCGCAVTGALADGTVPVEWNVTPLKSGAYIETFATVPEWATAVGSSTQAVKSAVSPLDNAPSRTNDWFAGATKALALDTEGGSITNELTETGSELPNAAVPATVANPAYIDMLVRFDALEDAPESSELTGAKLAIYAMEVSDEVKLICWANDSTYTSADTINTGAWNRVTIKLFGDNFTVLLNDEVRTFLDGSGQSVSEFSLANGGALSGTIFRGTGDLANLYVSHCDPKYGVAGATEEANKLLDSATVSDLNNVTNVTKIQKWMADNKTNVPSDASDANILTGYMLGADAPVSSADLSITSIDVLPPSQVKVTVGLAINGTAKDGQINGVLSLKGANTEGGAYSNLTDTVFTGANFTGGSAEFIFTVPSGYHIFKPVLSVQ